MPRHASEQTPISDQREFASSLFLCEKLQQRIHHRRRRRRRHHPYHNHHHLSCYRHHRLRRGRYHYTCRAYRK